MHGAGVAEQVGQGFVVAFESSQDAAVVGDLLRVFLEGAADGQELMAYCLDQFGPALKLPWTRLEAPELTRELRGALVKSCDDMADGRSFSTLSAERDAGLVAIAQAWNKIGKLL